MGFLAAFCPPYSCFQLSCLSRPIRVGLFWKRYFFRSFDPYQKFHSVTKLACWFSGMTEPTHFQVVHWKLKRSVSAPKCQFSPAGQTLIQPLLEPFEHNLSQNCPIKSLFQPGSKSALGNQTVLPRLSATIDPKIELYFTHRNGPIFTAKTDLSGLQCV